MNLNKLITSNWKFEVYERKLQSNSTLVNIILILSLIALLYGAIYSFIAKTHAMFYIEISAIIINIFLFLILKIKKSYFNNIVTFLVLEYLLFFALLILFGNPNDLKYIWIFTYPILLLYLKEKSGLYWIYALAVSIIMVKIQTFYPSVYSWYQISYIELCLMIITIIIKLYKDKLDENERLIKQQSKELKHFSTQLSQKERLLIMQSRQAAMGEMIQMIAHQWRQPLSTITLQIANLHFKAILQEVSKKEILKALDNISDTIIYLSDTIDDFQTYFRHDKQKQKINIYNTINKTIGFIKPRLKAKNININLTCNKSIYINSIINELIQVLINILNNAIDILVEKKTLAPYIEINAHNIPNNMIEIQISDNAGGISEDIIDKIFDPYFSTKGKNGNGIGLYMCKTITKNQLNGTIQAINIKQGAKFILTLPNE